MTSAVTGPLPGWTRRAATAQVFVITLCVAGDLRETADHLRAMLLDCVVLEQRVLDDQACDFIVKCLPERAWALLGELRQFLTAADVYLRPRDEMGKRLLICDMDMTIVAAETLDEVAAILGLGEQISAITARAMHGEIDFNDALRERIAMLQGYDEQLFHDLAKTLQLNPGAEELIARANAAGVHTLLISGGFAQVAQPVAARLGFDEVFCNHLLLDDGKLTGSVIEPIVNAESKLECLQQTAQKLGLQLADCCAIGDGANDRPMLEAAGLGIAYRGKPLLREATSCHIDHSSLLSAYYFMGMQAPSEH